MPPRESFAAAAWRWLGDNDTGIFLLLAIGAGFAIGSLVREWGPRAYVGLEGDDLRFFAARFFRPRDVWFYAILLLSVLLGLSLAVCSIDALRKRVRMRARDPRDYGPVLAHAGAALALVGHAIGGWWGVQEIGVAGARWTSLGPYDVRVVASEQRIEEGVVRAQRASLEVRDTRTGGTATREAAPNDPATWDAGTEMILLIQLQEGVDAAVLMIDGSADTLRAGESRLLEAGGRLSVDRLFGPPEFRVPVARVSIDGGPRAGSWLLGLGMPSQVPGISLAGTAGPTTAVLSYRHAPGTVWLLVAAIVFAAGTILTGLRWLRRWTMIRAARAVR